MRLARAFEGPMQSRGALARAHGGLRSWPGRALVHGDGTTTRFVAATDVLLGYVGPHCM
jgi:hypothetical protein